MLDKLEKLAKEATVGPYYVSRSMECGGLYNVISDSDQEVTYESEIHNAKFIAAANPETVLKLLVVVKAAKKLNDLLPAYPHEYGLQRELTRALKGLEK